MKRLAIPIGVLGAATLATACGSSSNGPSNPMDSGMDSTTEAGAATADAGPDSTTYDAESDATTDAGDGGVESDGMSADAAKSEASASCVPFDAGPLDDAAVTAGLAFIENTGHCTHCHQANPDAGITLSGNINSISDAGPVFPPNLTPDPATGIGCWTNAQIANAILYGIDPTVADGGLLCGLMPKFGVAKGDAGPALDDASVYNVVDFLRTLPSVVNQVPDTMCPILSTGTTTDAGDAASDAGTDSGLNDAGDAGDAPGD